MNILFIIPSYKPAYIYGGPIVTVAMLAEELVKLGHRVTVLTTTANGKKELKVPVGKPIDVAGVQVVYCKRVTGDPTHFSPQLWRYLRRHVKAYDAVHIHSWWNVLVIVAAWICMWQGVVPVLSPHGMFSNYILNTNNSFKKKLIQQLIGKRLLRHTYLHVSTHMEWLESQKIIPGWEGRIIPNLVALPCKNYSKPLNKVFKIGFISRIDPKKGLDILIQALSKVNFPFVLQIAGTGEESYVQSLQQLAKDCGTDHQIQWVGWKGGEEKYSFLSQLDLFALTSHSENFAIVVIESLAVGTPVLISKEVGLYDFVATNKFGWISDTSVASVTRQLNAIYQQQHIIKTINTKAPIAIQEAYAPMHLARQYIALYQRN